MWIGVDQVDILRRARLSLNSIIRRGFTGDGATFRFPRSLGLTLLPAAAGAVGSSLFALPPYTAAAHARLALSALVSLALLAGLALVARGRLALRPLAAPAGKRGEPGGMDADSGARGEQLRARPAGSERSRCELALLNDVALAAGQALDVQQLLDLALQRVVSRLGMRAGLIYLYDGETGATALGATYGLTPEQCAAIRRRCRLSDAGPGALPARVRVVRRLAEAPQQRGIWPDEERRFYVDVPLKSRGAVVGSMGLVSRVGQVPGQARGSVLEAVGCQIGIAIDNARLCEQARRMAVLEERDRLARELHDNLAQSLGYLNLKAAMTDLLLESGRLDDVRGSLREIKEHSIAAYQDVREAIFGLRAAASAEPGFVPRLREYLDEYRRHYGVHAELQVDAEDLVDLPPAVGLQTMRIVQEALTNVRRHGETDRARVRVLQREECLEVTIEDDGRGFDPTQAAAGGRQSFGLQVMRERAACVGGEMAVESRPGEGTRVRVRVPLCPCYAR